MIARAKKEATRHLEHGDILGTRRCLASSFSLVGHLRDASALKAEELAGLKEIEQMLDGDDELAFRKKAKEQAYRRRRCKPV